MTFSFVPFVAASQRAASFFRSSKVSEWLSPVVPLMNAKLILFFNNPAACCSTTA